MRLLIILRTRTPDSDFYSFNVTTEKVPQWGQKKIRTLCGWVALCASSVTAVSVICTDP